MRAENVDLREKVFNFAEFEWDRFDEASLPLAHAAHIKNVTLTR